MNEGFETDDYLKAKHARQRESQVQKLQDTTSKPVSLIQCQYYLHTETTQRHHKEIKLQANISHGYGYKTFNKIVANYIQQHMNGIIHQTTVQFMSSMQGWSGNQLIQCTILIFIQ